MNETVRNRSYFGRVGDVVGSYIDSIFESAARSIVRYRIGRIGGEQILRDAIEVETQKEIKSMMNGARSSPEQQFADLLRAEARNQVERAARHFPIADLIQNEVDSVIEPQLGPLVQRAINHAASSTDQQLVRAMRELLEEKFGADYLDALLRQAMSAVAEKVPRTKELDRIPKRSAARPGGATRRHCQFDRVRAMIGDFKVGQVTKVLMVGPAGSGKTMIAEQIAVDLGQPFYFNGPIQSEYKLTGYKDATGRYHYTPFRQAFEHGGVYLFDELDACSAQALVVFNTALSNKLCDFPDRLVHQHPEFICLAAANTYGSGATSVYAGRERIDGATLDRFAVIDIKYDEQLERDEANNLDWVTRVQQLRQAAVKTGNARLIVSMRASIEGARLLARGVPLADVEHAVIWRGQLAASAIADIKKAAGVI